MAIYKVKSVVISRKPAEKRDGTWSAFIGLFDENNPHLKAKEPLQVLEFKYIEKVRIRDLRNVSYYLAGNDVVINNLKELQIDVAEKIMTLTGRQELPGK